MTAMLDRVILPFSGGRRELAVLRHAMRLCEVLDAGLVVLTSGDLSAGEVESLARRAADLSEERLVVRPVVAYKPADAVRTTIDALDAEGSRTVAVVMTTHGRTGLARAVLGSVAEEVVAAVDVPVLLVGPRCELPDQVSPSEVIACVDGPTTTEAVVALAGAVSERFGVRALVAHVRVPGEGDRTAGADGHGDADAADRVALAAASLAPRAAGVEVAMLDAGAEGGDDGDRVAARLVSFAASRPGAVLVLGTHARHGRARRRQGSVAMEVVAGATAPVLVRGPDGGDP